MRIIPVLFIRFPTFLARHKLNITDVNSRIIGEQNKSVYALVIEVDIPKSFDIGKLEEEFEAIRSELNVDVTLKKVDALESLKTA